MKKLYVGNLAYKISEDDLVQIFSEVGEVASATVIRDRATNRSKGFGFVEMKDESGASAAIERLNGRDLEGRALRISEAREKQSSGGGGGGGGRPPRGNHSARR